MINFSKKMSWIFPFCENFEKVITFIFQTKVPFACEKNLSNSDMVSTVLSYFKDKTWEYFLVQDD